MYYVLESWKESGFEEFGTLDEALRYIRKETKGKSFTVHENGWMTIYPERKYGEETYLRLVKGLPITITQGGEEAVCK